MLGAWIYEPFISPYDAFVFYNAIGQNPDYYYQPVAVAKQVVNGTNFRFVCIARAKNPNGITHFAIVEIYKPIATAAYVTTIYPIE